MASRMRTSAASKAASIVYWILAAAAYSLLVSQGSLRHMLEPNLGKAFDSLAVSLLHGSSEIKPYAIGFEAFVVEGRTYMYFGPWPALLRILPLAVCPSLFGHITRISFLIAALAALTGLGSAVRLSVNFNKHLGPRMKFWLLWPTLYAFAFASPIPILASDPGIFQEAIIWALACSSWFLYFMARCLLYKETSPLIYWGASWAAAGALLSRITYGIPLYAALAVLIVLVFLDSELKNRRRLVAALLLPAAVGVLFQAWYNYDRFGSAWSTCPMQYYLSAGGYMPAIEKHGIFSLQRLPGAFLVYFELSFRHLSSNFPFVFPMEPRVLPGYQGLFVRGEPLVPLTLFMPWILAAAAAGAALIIYPLRRTRLAAVGAVLAVQPLLILSFHSLIGRYSGDFFPFLTYCLMIFLAYARLPCGGRPIRAAAIPAVWSALVLASVTATGGWLFAGFEAGLSYSLPFNLREEWQQKCGSIRTQLGLSRGTPGQGAP